MRPYVQAVGRSLLFLLITTSAWAATLKPTGAAVPGEVLVKIRAGASQGAMAGILAEADEGQRLATVESGTLWRMQSRSRNADALATALQKNPNIVYAEPNYILRLVATPNDPAYASSLWALKNTGQDIFGMPGAAGSDIDAEPAWTATTGSSSVVIGVVDTGVDYLHPDLAANMWSNPGGKGNAACAAGTHGFNAITGTCNPMDDHYHGTHVAGTIGAVGNNGVGITGVNWTTSIMALKFLNSQGYGTTADAIAAIGFAVQAKIDGVNVRVLSNSWGGGGFSKALLDEINHANEHDILFVAAAGNYGYSNDLDPLYPASYATPNMIAVAATDNQDGLAWFSNYGPTTVHLGAPGVNILSSVPGGYYDYLSGTSMAAPHVSGVAALLLAQAPGSTTAQVKSAILSSTDPIASLAGKTITGGRLNAAKALGVAVAPEFTLSVSPSSRSAARGTSTAYTVTVVPANGFAGSVNFSVSGLPAGTTGSFSPNPATATSTLTVTVGNSTPFTTFSFTITGVSGALTRTATASLTVVATPVAACPSFAAPITYTIGTTPASGVTGDFNRDGRTDLAVALVSLNRVSVRTGNGNGTFGSAVTYVVGTAPIAVATGDFDADGRTDLVTANSGSNDVSVLLASDTGFDAAVAYAAGTSPFAVAAGDFNNDGKSDLAVANNSSSNVSILIGAGDGTFAAPVSYAAASGPFALAVADFDRDGNADLAVADYNDDQVSILLGNGNGTFAAAVHYATGSGPSSVAAGDLNGDGRLDLAVSNYESDDISILDGNGDGTFEPAVDHVAGAGLYSVAIADFNGDGKSDLIVANGDSNTVSILLGVGDGTYQTPNLRTVGSEPDHVVTGDFNGDAKPDFAVTNSGSESISVVLNGSVCTLSCGVFAPYPDTPVYAITGAPFALAGGDFNGDGSIDLAAGTRSPNNVTILNGNADGTFATGAVAGVGTNPDSVAVGDFNRDGALDVVTANSGSGNVSVVAGNGNGTFQAAVNYAAGTTPRSVSTADFNRDGKLDLAVATAGTNSVAVLLGNGDGTFQAPLSTNVGTTPFNAMPGDFNRDGMLDLAVANSGSANISILLGNGNGTFQAATNYAAGTTPRSIAVHDLDRNGKLDLVVANAGSNNVSVYLGLGDGTFQAAVHYLTGAQGPFHVSAGDLTDDGIADLIVSNNTAGGLTILTGSGTGTFGAGAQYWSGGAGPAVSVLADFDRDGKLDVAVAHPGFGNVGIMRNRCPAPDLKITKTHSGSFAQASQGKTYTITVQNVGLAPTNGPVVLQELLPPSLTATDMNASGWNCSFATSSCTRSDPLPAGFSQVMTLTVSVAAGAPASVTNVVTISGGGELNTANNTASDPTTITPIVDLLVTSTHTGSFTQGATGKMYSLLVRNIGGLPTSGLVTVTDTLPAGLTATGIGGSGWSCSLPSRTCNRSDVLAGGASYPPITLTVSVAGNAPAAVQNIATVIGGSDTNGSNNSGVDPTVIWAAQTCGSFGMPQHYDTDSDAYDVLTGRFNADSYADLAVTNFYSGSVSILLGKPDGSFHDPVEYAAGSYPSRMAMANFSNSNDAHNDLVVINYYHGTLSLLLGNGDGTFAAPVTYELTNGLRGLAVGDFNGDGKPDVAVTHQSGTLFILLGGGNGTLQDPVAYTAGSDPYELAVADFDGNGTADLVVTHNYTNAVSVLLGFGDGTFGAAASYTVAYNSTGVAVGDFNQDGKRDLAVPSPYYSQVAILLGNGNGTFQTAAYYEIDYGAVSVVAEDLNGDGKTDLALGSDGYGSLSILFGNGDGTFDPFVSHYTDGAGGRMAIGDFNNDGRPDLALSGYYSEVVVLLGGCADLSIAKSHSGNFSSGQQGVYTITVSNVGTGAAQGPVTVTDLLPTGLTAASMFGSGWSCTTATATCLSQYSLPAGESSSITLYVNVAGNAAENVVNTATVSGGGDTNGANNTATDPTTIVQVPDLTVDKSHSGAFAQGQLGRTYTIVVTNVGGAPTNGVVTVTDLLPSKLVATDLSGPGWSCNAISCWRNDVLAPQSSYPPVTMTVNVLSTAPSTVVNYATVTGGGDSNPYNNEDADSTIILTTPTNLVATALSATNVYIAWDAPVHATSYQLYRSSNGGPFQLLGNAGSNAFSDLTVVPNTSYLYRVRALAGATASAFSNVDLATTIIFTDDPLAAGTRIKAAHVTELRAAVAAIRVAAGLPAGGFTDPALSSTSFISAVHWNELRNGVDEARAALALLGIAWSDPVLTPGGTGIKAAHMRELRSAVR